ncbi:hypothetical protein [Marmoricola sp. RAF53]|uniref:hypothetical protein n=1 Tax=Marmoricola sp. RAF53 TaxID=3233059 RepID=UPI003F9BCDCC
MNDPKDSDAHDSAMKADDSAPSQDTELPADPEEALPDERVGPTVEHQADANGGQPH